MYSFQMVKTSTSKTKNSIATTSFQNDIKKCWNLIRTFPFFLDIKEDTSFKKVSVGEVLKDHKMLGGDHKKKYESILKDLKKKGVAPYEIDWLANCMFTSFDPSKMQFPRNKPNKRQFDTALKNIKKGIVDFEKLIDDYPDCNTSNMVFASELDEYIPLSSLFKEMKRAIGRVERWNAIGCKRGPEADRLRDNDLLQLYCYLQFNHSLRYSQIMKIMNDLISIFYSQQKLRMHSSLDQNIINAALRMAKRL